MLLCLFCSNSDILSKSFRFVKYFFHLFDSVPGSFFMIPQLPVSAFFWRTSVFYRICHLLSSTFFKKFVERRKRDLNPRAAVNDLLPFQGSPFSHLGISPKCLSMTVLLNCCSLTLSRVKRREWDSNPRALADKRFSRPPRYDHFDISPWALSTSDFVILAVYAHFVNYIFRFFSIFFTFLLQISKKPGFTVFFAEMPLPLPSHPA